MPKSISYAFGEPIVELAEIGRAPGPFLSDLDTAHAARTRRMPLMDVTMPPDSALPAPAGFVYHLPRSGSTLMARMLAALDSTVCIVEPEAINALLSLPEARGRVRPEWLRRLVQLYTLALGDQFDRVFVKLSSWTILHAPAFASAFPSTPGCFIHRDPTDVIVQLLDRPTGWMAVDARPLMLDDPRAPAMDTEEYCARMLGRFCDTARRAAPLVRAVAYETQAHGMISLIRDHFMELTDAASEALLRVSLYDSDDWSMQRPWTAPTVPLRARASPQLRELVERHAAPARTRLLESSAHS